MSNICTRVQIYVNSDAVADIGSPIFSFQFMYLLTQQLLVCDLVFSLLSQRTWAAISITQTASWLIHCHSLPDLSSINLTNGHWETQREKGIMMVSGVAAQRVAEVGV